MGCLSKSSLPRVGFLGALLLVTTLVVLLLGPNSVVVVSWTHQLVITSFMVSALLFFGAFGYGEKRVACETHHSDPIDIRPHGGVWLPDELVLLHDRARLDFFTFPSTSACDVCQTRRLARR